MVVACPDLLSTSTLATDCSTTDKAIETVLPKVGIMDVLRTFTDTHTPARRSGS
jgi:hypothetical protein